MNNNDSRIISLIVPVYNVEPYFEQCLNSLFGQTIAQNIQYIFVNDASSDGSMEILRSSAAKHPDLEIIVIEHERNSGLAAARITGLSKATCPYIMVADSDDFIELNMAEVLLKAAVDKNADFVACAHYVFSNGKDKAVLLNDSSTTINLNDISIDVLHLSIWGKLISRDLIIDNDLYPSPSHDCWEDVAVTTRALALASNAIIINTPLYHYRQVGTSITRQNHKKRLEDHLFYAQALAEWFKAKDADFYNKHREFLLRLQFCSKIKMLRGDILEISRWKSTFPDTQKHIFACSRQFGIGYRLAFKALAICPTKAAIAIAHLLGKNAQ